MNGNPSASTTSTRRMLMLDRNGIGAGAAAAADASEGSGGGGGPDDDAPPPPAASAVETGMRSWGATFTCGSTIRPDWGLPTLQGMCRALAIALHCGAASSEPHSAIMPASQPARP